MRRERYDVVIVGGGFFGIALALEARRYKRHVLLVEAEAELMQRSSYGNQARIHQGYHYPRSLLTAERSSVNFPLFVAAYRECVVNDFDKLYAIARQNSKVSAAQFVRFCERVGAPLAKAPLPLRKLFDEQRVEEVFSVREYAFDSVKLRSMVERELTQADVEVQRGAEVTCITPGGALTVEVRRGPLATEEVLADWVFNVTYANLNELLARSNLERVPLKHEFVELTIVRPPPPLRQLGVTLMDGPFFSCMPFPSLGAHSFTHVRYTPHGAWLDGEDHAPRRSRLSDLRGCSEQSTFSHMVRDAARFVPGMVEAEYLHSIWEVKTLLPQSERDDSRPILFRQNAREPRVVSILGAKIDNVIDMAEPMKKLLS